MHPPGKSAQSSCPEPKAGRGSCLQTSLPHDGKCCLPTSLNSFISVLFIIPCPAAESDAKLFCHMLLPQTTVQDRQIFSCCEVSQASPMETRNITAEGWCKDSLLTAGCQTKRLGKCKRVSLSCYIRQWYFHLKATLLYGIEIIFPLVSCASTSSVSRANWA